MVKDKDKKNKEAGAEEMENSTDTEEWEIELIGKSEYLLAVPDSQKSKGYGLVHWKGIGHRLTVKVNAENRSAVESALNTGWLRRNR